MIGLILATGAGYILALIFLILNRYHIAAIDEARFERQQAVAARDRFALQCGVAIAERDEAEARLEEIATERNDLRRTHDQLAAQLADRDEEIERLRTQLSEVQYVKLDTPKRPSRVVMPRKKANGEDGTI